MNILHFLSSKVCWCCIELSERYKLLLGDFREVGKQIPDNSIDMIFTDPPYLKDNLMIYDDLGKFANRVLRDGGSLITYGLEYAPVTVLKLLEPYFDSIIILTMKYHKQKALLYVWRMFVTAKLLAWCIKGKRNQHELINNCIESRAYSGKKHHIWEQNVRDAEYYIKKLSRNEGIVCDPFLGSGTTGIAALKQNRKFIGIEKEEATYRIAEKRIRESINYQLSKWQ